MSVLIGVSLRGFKELDAALAALPAKVQGKALRKAVGAGAQVLRAAVVREAPRRTGTYAGAIRMGFQRPRPGDTGVTYRVFVNRKAMRMEVQNRRVYSLVPGEVREIIDRRGKRRRVRLRRKVFDASGARKLGYKKNWPYIYGRFLEFGTRRMRAHPTFGPAAAQAAANAVRALGATLAFELDAIAREAV